MLDVLVIGGGLAGSVAALRAAAGGAQVGLASGGWGLTAQCRGALELAAASAADADAALAVQVRTLAQGQPQHPYAKMGAGRAAAQLRAGCATLAAALRPCGLWGQDLDEAAANRPFRMPSGGQRMAALALAPHLLPAGLAQIGLIPAHRSRAAAGRHERPLPVPLPLQGAPLAVARQLDDMAAVEALIVELRPQMAGLDGLLFPALLGLQRWTAVHARLREGLGVPIAETLGSVAPSVPGLRLMQALGDALATAGVQRFGALKRCERGGGRCQAAILAQDGTRIAAHSFVLATGRFASGGLIASDPPREPLLDLPLMRLGAAGPSVGASLASAQPLLGSGVQVDGQLRPAAAGWAPLNNVFVAGMLLGGYDGLACGSADGVALASGHAAAEEALRSS